MRISANIASLVERKEQLINTINSLINQVDEVNVCLNNYTEPPLEHPKVNYFYSDNVFGDAGRFIFLENFEGYALFADDDLIYPETYVADMIKAIDKYKIVSHHGRKFTSFPIKSYYREPSHRFRCLDKVEYCEPIQIAGTGVLGFHTDTIKPPMSAFPERNLADIYFSIYADSLGLDIWVLAHEKGYIKYQDIPVENTIWGQKKDKDEFETKVINDYFMNKK